MLQNEKYMGDALLQKTYIADLFSHQSKKNMGELPKYYVHDCHPAIIDRETFHKVQEEFARRASLRKVSPGRMAVHQPAGKWEPDMQALAHPE